MAKLKIVENTAKYERYGNLAPGELFYACGDIAIKTTNEWAVVLKDGNYVRRNDDDRVSLVERAELRIFFGGEPEKRPEYQNDDAVNGNIIYRNVCKRWRYQPSTGCAECELDSGVKIKNVLCNGCGSRCESGSYEEK